MRSKAFELSGCDDEARLMTSGGAYHRQDKIKRSAAGMAVPCVVCTVVLGKEATLHDLDEDMQDLDLKLLHSIGILAHRRANVHGAQSRKDGIPAPRE